MRQHNTGRITRLARGILLCVMILALSICPGTALALMGAGTEEEPYLISTADDLDEFRNKVNRGEYNAWGELTCDIDLSELTVAAERASWTPIGYSNKPYIGTFDGCGYTIMNLKITNSTDSHTGLFSYVRDGAILNLTVQGYVSASGNVGLIVGRINPGSSIGATIRNCHAIGNVTGTGTESTGGIVGDNYRGNIINCTYSDGKVSGGALTGGIVGNNYGGQVINCISSGTVEGGSECTMLGGIAGLNDNAMIQNCVNMGDVVCESSSPSCVTGGIAGRHSGYREQEAIVNCISTGIVSMAEDTDRSRTGGIAGSSSGPITNCGYVMSDSIYAGVPNGMQGNENCHVLTQEAADAAVVALTSKISSSTIPQNSTATITLETNHGEGTFGTDGAVRDISIKSSPEGIVKTERSGGTITITGLTEGTTVITVSAQLYAPDFSTGSGYVNDNVLDYETSYTVTVTAPAEIPLTGISLLLSSLDMKIHDTATLTVSHEPKSAPKPEIEWTSSKPEVAKVEDGLITALKEGQTKITAKAKGTAEGTEISDSCEIIITPVSVESFTITQPERDYYLDGSEYTFCANIEPADATYKNVVWTLSGSLIDSGSVYFINEDSLKVDGNTYTGATATIKTTSAAEAGTISLTAETVGTTAQGGKLTASVPNIYFSLPNVSKITLDTSELEIDLNSEDNAMLIAAVSPSNAQYGTVTWKITPKIAEISFDDTDTQQTAAIITPTAGGEATITASVGEFSDSCMLKVIPVEATGITISPKSLSLEAGRTAQLTAIITPDNVTDKTVIWTSSDSTIVSVDDNGLVTAHDAGTATITARPNNATADSKISASCTVSVTLPPVPVESVTIEGDEKVELSLGKTLQLTATVSPANATNPKVTWTSSTETVVTVTQEGLVTAVSAGTAEIRATSADGQFSDSVTITVTGGDNPEDEDTPPAPTGGGGGGCSTGLGALALLAVIPLAIRRNKR